MITAQLKNFQHRIILTFEGHCVNIKHKYRGICAITISTKLPESVVLPLISNLKYQRRCSLIRNFFHDLVLNDREQTYLSNDFAFVLGYHECVFRE